jgi:hypothetical protein
VWYAITWINKYGDPVKREVLHRDSDRKVWEFLKGRVNAHNVPQTAAGFVFMEALEEEKWDYDYDEPRAPGNHAEDIDVVDDYFAKDMETQLAEYRAKVLEGYERGAVDSKLQGDEDPN